MSYIQDPNNPNKQIPNTQNIGWRQRFGYSTLPAPESINKNPSNVIVNGSGSYAFIYESGSVATYISGAFVQTDDAGGINIDINPVAWRRTDATGVVGDVTFVYRRIA